MKIIDNNIDMSKVKCWCIFGDPSFTMQPVDEAEEDGIWHKTKEMSKNAAKKTWQYVTSKLSRATKHATIGRKHNSLAFMAFSCKMDNGKLNDYVFTFNYKKCRWYLLNAGLGVGNSSTAFPSKEEIQSFLQTQACKKFIAACKKYIMPWLKDTSKIEKLAYAFQHAGGSTSEMLTMIAKSKDKVVSNMFDMNVASSMLIDQQ